MDTRAPSDQIEMVLYLQEVPGWVTGGVVTPRCVRFEIIPALGAKVISVVRLSEELALRLGDRRDGLDRVRGVGWRDRHWTSYLSPNSSPFTGIGLTWIQGVFHPLLEEGSGAQREGGDSVD